ncbi:hypothetical protein [Streptomyces virginiae]|uniref:hypothetical protein n=1 Tax=Streptomyces virginiae TaxID=1961 RepID=UPI003325BC0B
MSDFRHDAIDEVGRVRAQRLEAAHGIETLCVELKGVRQELLMCSDLEGERVRDLMYAASRIMEVWLDTLACRLAEPEQDANEIFARAWQFVDDLPLEASGFLSREDAALFTTLRGSAASVLAHIWISGFLIGSIPENAWPNHELAAALLGALDRQADARALSESIDHYEFLANKEREEGEAGE